MVKVLDFAPIHADATKWLQANKPDRAAEVTRFSSGFPIGYVQTKNGDVYVLTSDGVGSSNPISDRNPYGFALYGENDDKVTLTIEPDVRCTLSKDNILELPVKEEVNLAEFIRTFGSRLDANYEEWRTALEPLV